MYWTLTRTDTQTTIHLHPQFDWADEHDWTAVAQSDPVYMLSGAMDIQQGIKKCGRPITLNGDNARIRHATIKTLQDWANVSELIMTLTHPKGQSHQVIFSRPFISNIRSFVAYRPSDIGDDDNYQLNLHFITV